MAAAGPASVARGGKREIASLDLGPFASLPRRARELGVALDPARARLLLLHFQRVLDANRTLNLTRVTDPEEAIRKLYLASLALLPALADAGVAASSLGEYLDLGTGAGFPGVPLAVACPHFAATLIDARAKKVRFLDRAVREIGIANVVVRHVRGADLVREAPRSSGSFDLITSRAVAPLDATLRELAGLPAPGGVIAVYKGPDLTREERDAGLAVARALGWEFLGEKTPAVEGLTPRLLLFTPAS